MTELRVRNLDGWIVDHFKALAKSNGRSLEAELRNLFQKEAHKSKQRVASSIRRNLAKLKKNYGVLPDSTPGIRTDRDKNG